MLMTVGMMAFVNVAALINSLRLLSITLPNLSIILVTNAVTQKNFHI